MTNLLRWRELWKKTTPGRWSYAWIDRATGEPPHIVQLDDEGHAVGTYLIAQVGPKGDWKPLDDQCYANADFICAAHNEWPELLDRLEAAEAKIRQLQEQLGKDETKQK